MIFHPIIQNQDLDNIKFAFYESHISKIPNETAVCWYYTSLKHMTAKPETAEYDMLFTSIKEE